MSTNRRYSHGKSNNRRNNYRRNRRSNRYRGRNTKKINRSLYINEAKETPKDEQSYEGVNFSTYNLNPKLYSNLKQKGFNQTTKVQEKVIPLIQNGQEVLGISETGSGKTAAFLIPILEKMLKNKTQRLLIVAPTRELALQIKKETVSLVKGTKLYATLIVGGESMGKQISQLRRGSEIIIGTPGRLIDLIKRNKIKTQEINNIVVDEVDRMMDMGFISDIQFIFEKIGKQRQASFFSATHNRKVEEIVGTLTQSFKIIKLSNNTPNESVSQKVIDYKHRGEKMGILKDLLNKDEVEKAIIFVETKRFADQVTKDLYRSKFRVDVIHGDKRQNVRKRVIGKFRKSQINFLVATNVAARGIDIDDITHVINLDEPQTYDEYIHRIGRTGRNGETGTAYTFVKR